MNGMKHKVANQDSLRLNTHQQPGRDIKVGTAHFRFYIFLVEFGNDSVLESGLRIRKIPGLGADLSWKSEDPGRGRESRKFFLYQLGSRSVPVFSLTIICVVKI